MRRWFVAVQRSSRPYLFATRPLPLLAAMLEGILWDECKAHKKAGTQLT